MKSEAEFCTVIVHSMQIGVKVPDPSGAYAMTVKRPFDIFGSIDDCPAYIEAKFNKTLSAFNLKRIEPHQAMWLSEFEKVKNAKCYLILGVYAGRADLRAYVFDCNALKPYYDEQKSILAKMLEKLPYNKVSKNMFQFENIITAEHLKQMFQ